MTRLMLAVALPMMLSLAACDAAVESFNEVGKGVEAEIAAEESAARRAAYTPAQAAYAEANNRMHNAMGSNIPADADVAFVQGMIPHHQGAIDMARIVLEHGTDPENQALARAIIANQEAEIAGMRSWLQQRNLPGVDATGAQVGNPDTAVASPETATEAEVDHSKMGH